MSKKQVYRILSIISFLIGVFFLLNSKINITGAAVGVSISSPLSSFMGFFLILTSSMLFLSGNLEDKVKYDPKIKSFRRYLKKREHHKISYNEAEVLYKDALKSYYRAISLGKIKQTYGKKPLKYIEDYIKTFNIHISEKFSDKAKKLLNEAGISLEEGRIYDKSRELIRLADRLGYDTTEHTKEGIRVKDADGSIITEIPNHPTVNINTAKGIMKSLAKGKGSFRKSDRRASKENQES